MNRHGGDRKVGDWATSQNVDKMQTVWELCEGNETYGTVRGGLGKEKVRFEFPLTKGGYYYFVCSLPYELNQKGSVTLEKLALHKKSIFARLSDSSQSRFSVDLSFRVWNQYQTIFEKSLILDLASVPEKYECFEIPEGFVPVNVEVELEGHSFFKKLRVAASLHRYGRRAPQNDDEAKIVARMGTFLLNRTMKTGEDNFEAIVAQEEQELLEDLKQLGSVPRQQSAVSRQSSYSSSMSGPVMYEIESTTTIGDAMFYLLDKAVLSCPVYDPAGEEYVGLFDIQDAMQFTFKLYEMTQRRGGRRRAGSFSIHGVEIDSTETDSGHGLDLPVSTFFHDNNKELAPLVSVDPATSMKKVLKCLGDGTKRICVIDNTKKVVKVISQSEIMSQVFHRYIQPNLEPKKREYFLTTELNEEAVERGVKVFGLDDTISRAFRAIIASKIVDVVPVVDDDGKLLSSITPVDAWFVCRAELDRSDPVDLSRFSIREFIEMADEMSEEHLAKKRSPTIGVSIDTPLKDIISKLVQHKIHGVFIVDDDGKPIGRVNVNNIVQALEADNVGIFKLGENVQNVFLFDRKSDLARPTVDQAIRRAASRSRKRRDQTKKNSLSSSSSSASELDGFVLVDKPKDAPKRTSNIPFVRPRSKSPAALYRFGGKPTSDSILQPEQLAQLEEHLPTALSGGLWTCVFHMRRDGSSALALREGLGSRLVPLVVVIEDQNGHVFGGFLPSGLYFEENQNDHHYVEGPGDGESFVFSFGRKTSRTSPRVFKWTKENRCFRFLTTSTGFGMGGGGKGFAFFLDEILSEGTSDESDTYGNEVLASDQAFHCINLEIFAITTSIVRRGGGTK